MLQRIWNIFKLWLPCSLKDVWFVGLIYLVWKALKVKNACKIFQIKRHTSITVCAVKAIFSFVSGCHFSLKRLRKLLACYDPKEPVHLGEVYGYSVAKKNWGYTYIMVGEGKYRDSFYFSSSPKILSCGATVSHFISLNKLILILMNLRYLPTSWCNI